MAYNALLPDEQRALAEKSPDYIGVEPTEEMAKWLWDNQFSAVAGDAVAFERSPPGRGKTAEALPPTVTLHQWLLGGWGMPIGELFDLEELASHCRKVGRWSFFLSSVPLKVGPSFLRFIPSCFLNCLKLRLCYESQLRSRMLKLYRFPAELQAHPTQWPFFEPLNSTLYQ